MDAYARRIHQHDIGREVLLDDVLDTSGNRARALRQAGRAAGRGLAIGFNCHDTTTFTREWNCCRAGTRVRVEDEVRIVRARTLEHVRVQARADLAIHLRKRRRRVVTRRYEAPCAIRWLPPER